MSSVIGFPCEECGAVFASPLQLAYDPESSRMLCFSCAAVAVLAEAEDPPELLTHSLPRVARSIQAARFAISRGKTPASPLSLSV